MKYALLLRGINLGPSRKVGMADLREALAESGLGDAATYLRSGNAVVDSDMQPADVKRRAEVAIEERFGIEVGVVVVSTPEMETVIASCPYREQAEHDPTKVHVTFLDSSITPDDLAAIEPAAFAPDELSVGERVIYMHLPNGMGRAKLPVALEKATREQVATTRNWRTVLALGDMLSEP